MLTDYAEDAWVDLVFLGSAFSSPAAVYAALWNTGDPGDDGLTGSEESATGYARQAITLGAPSGGVCTNTSVVRWSGVTGSMGTVSGWAIFDAATGGNMLAHGALSPTITHSAGEPVVIPVGELSLTYDAAAGKSSTYLANAALSHIFRSTAFTSPSSSLYLSLHTGSPGTTGANEVSTSGTGYGRISVTMEASGANGDVQLSSTLAEFVASGGNFGTCTYWGLWDASTSGNFLCSGQLNSGTGYAVNDGDEMYFAATSLHVTVA